MHLDAVRREVPVDVVELGVSGRVEGEAGTAMTPKCETRGSST